MKTVVAWTDTNAVVRVSELCLRLGRCVDGNKILSLHWLTSYSANYNYYHYYYYCFLSTRLHISCTLMDGFMDEFCIWKELQQPGRARLIHNSKFENSSCDVGGATTSLKSLKPTRLHTSCATVIGATMVLVLQTTSWMDLTADPHAKWIHSQSDFWVWLSRSEEELAYSSVYSVHIHTYCVFGRYM